MKAKILETKIAIINKLARLRKKIKLKKDYHTGKNSEQIKAQIRPVNMCLYQVRI